MLDQFRTQKLEWNRANNQIYDRVEANSGDSNGRTLFVQILNGGMVEDLTGAVLSLAWNKRTEQGLEAFEEVDAKKGQFRLYYPTGMLVNPGVLQASLVLVDVTGRIESKPFDIIVHKGTVDDEAVESDNKFTALTTALVKVSQVQAEFDGLYADKSQMMDTLKVEKSNEMDQLYDDKNQALTGLESDFADKAENLETTYAPRLTSAEQDITTNHQEVTAQLAQIAPHLLKNTINVKSLGVVGDGSDETIVFKNALEYAADNHLILYVPIDMTIHVDTVSMVGKSNFGILCDGIIKRLDNSPTIGSILSFFNCNNINIPTLHLDGNALENGASETATYTVNQEQKHSLLFRNCANVKIGTFYVNNPCGDGIYIGDDSKDFTINKIVGRADERIGRNILSIISARNIYIENIDSETIGHYAMPGGFDIEPNSNTEVVENIFVNRIHIISGGSNPLSVLNTNDALVKNITVNNAYVKRDVAEVTGLSKTSIRLALLCGEDVNVNHLHLVNGGVTIDNLGITSRNIRINDLQVHDAFQAVLTGEKGLVEDVFIDVVSNNVSNRGIEFRQIKGAEVIVNNPRADTVVNIIMSGVGLGVRYVVISGNLSHCNGRVFSFATGFPLENINNITIKNLDLTGVHPSNIAGDRNPAFANFTKLNVLGVTHRNATSFVGYKKGDVIYNTNPVILGEEGNQYIVDRWIAKEDGSGSNIWIESRVLTGS